MEKEIIKLARFATELTPLELEITEASAYYGALEQYVIENPDTEESISFHEITNITGGMNVIIARIHIELAFKDFSKNGITEKEMTYFNKIQKDYNNMISIFIELANQSERLKKQKC